MDNIDIHKLGCLTPNVVKEIMVFKPQFHFIILEVK